MCHLAKRDSCENKRCINFENYCCYINLKHKHWFFVFIDFGVMECLLENIHLYKKMNPNIFRLWSLEVSQTKKWIYANKIL